LIFDQTYLYFKCLHELIFVDFMGFN